MTRKDTVFAVLGGFFITNAILAEIIGGKLIYFPELINLLVNGLLWIFSGGTQEVSWDPAARLGGFGPFIMSVGVIPWPVVFVTTDLVNEYFGRRGVRRLTFLTVGLIIYAFVVIGLTMLVSAVPPEAPGKGVDDASYRVVLGQSLWIIAGSVTAFLVSQLVDVVVFHVVRRRTGKGLLWLRATGSTVVSQLIDSLIVLYIGLAIPRDWDTTTFLTVAATNYAVKLLIALAMTPVIYLGHWAIEKYLGPEEAALLAENAARESAGGR